MLMDSVFTPSFAKTHIYNVRETNTAVNKLANNPMTSVTAKPRIGPVPKAYKNKHETIVVT